MARPRTRRPVQGKPQRVFVRPRMKNGEIVYYYGYCVDEAGQEHSIGRQETPDREEAHRMAEDWLAGNQGGTLFIRTTREARKTWLHSLGRSEDDHTYH